MSVVKILTFRRHVQLYKICPNQRRQHDSHHHHCSDPQLYDERKGPLLDDNGHVHSEGSSGRENPLQGDGADDSADGGGDSADADADADADDSDDNG